MSRRPRPRRRTVLALALPAAVLAAGPAAAAPDDLLVPPGPRPVVPAPVTLDPVAPVALAADGPRLAWVRDLGRGARALVVRDAPDAAERVVVPRLRMRVARLAVGTDAAGRPTAVLATGGDVDPSISAEAPASGALFAVRLDGRGGVRRLPASGPRGAEVAPGLRRGVLSFARVERIGRRPVMTLRVGALHRASSRVLWHGSPDRPVIATAVGAGRRVVFTTHSSPGEVNVWNLRVARPGATTRNLERLPSGFNTNAGYGPITTDATGTAVAVSRWRSNGYGGVLSRHDLRTGRRTGTRSFDELDLAVPLGDRGIAAYRTDLFASCEVPGGRPGLDPCPLTSLPAR